MSKGASSPAGRVGFFSFYTAHWHTPAAKKKKRKREKKAWHAQPLSCKASHLDSKSKRLISSIFLGWIHISCHQREWTKSWKLHSTMAGGKQTWQQIFLPRKILLSFHATRDRDIHPLSLSWQGNNSHLPLYPRAPAQLSGVSPRTQRNPNGKEERKKRPGKMEIQVTVYRWEIMQGKDKRKKKTKTGSIRKKNLVINEREVTPAQNRRLAHELALSLNFRKTYEKHSPITLPSRLSSRSSRAVAMNYILPPLRTVSHSWQ